MEYSAYIEKTLKPAPTREPLVVDLFAGCGGLALGFEAQGFETRGYEMDATCCATYRRNLSGGCEEVKLALDTELPPATVLIGGPPCQPFSVIGKQNGIDDERNGFPIFISAVKRLNPDIFLFENVRGLLYRSKPYFDEVVNQLKACGYVIEYDILNAVDFDVPQRRERLFVVGHRGSFLFPKRCSRQFTAGDALGSMATSCPAESRFLTKSMDEYVARYEAASFCVRPRDLHLDEPARTLTCRNLAGATSDMQRIRLPDGRRRRLVAREAARLQSFPDWFAFEGSEQDVFNQIGNAVPPMLAFHLAGSVREYLNTPVRLSSAEITYRNLPPQLELGLAHVAAEKKEVAEFVTVEKKRDTAVVINEALHVLSVLGIPFEGLTPRRLEKMAMAFLAVCDVKEPGQWGKAKDADAKRSLTSRQIIEYINSHFEEDISSGSYDDIRRKDLKLPTVAGIILKSANDPDASTNNPSRAYALNPDYTQLIRAYGTGQWEDDVEDFLPRYGEGAEVLYVGDAADKFLHIDKPALQTLRFFELAHEQLPDIIAYSKPRNWIYLVEVVHSSGPISKLRHEELRELTKQCTADIVYVTAFLDRETYRKFASDIAWETEVWIAEVPDHIIHFDGKRFLGPYKST